MALSAKSGWLAQLWHRRRVRLGKEDAERRSERFGLTKIKRPQGRLAWFHSASIGEAVSILELVHHLGKIRYDASFLLTTGTITSAEVLKSRLPPQAVHQFIPYDVLPAVETFLDHWRPDLGIWTESELWPALICETYRRKVPMLCVNARMSEASFRRWRWAPETAQTLLNKFDEILVQDNRTARRLLRLGLASSRMEVVGSLKKGGSALPFNKSDHKEFFQVLGGRQLWLAASTHEGEEQVAATAHRKLSDAHSSLLLVIVPRHPDRGTEIAEMLSSQGFAVSLRSKSKLPNSKDQIFVADTLGELGLWYRLAPVSFLGGSLVNIGGHNPLEPARLRSAIVHGPCVTNFSDEFQEMAELGAVIQTNDASGLAAAVEFALDSANRSQLTTAAAKYAADGDRITRDVANVILDYLPESAPK